MTNEPSSLEAGVAWPHGAANEEELWERRKRAYLLVKIAAGLDRSFSFFDRWIVVIFGLIAVGAFFLGNFLCHHAAIYSPKMHAFVMLEGLAVFFAALFSTAAYKDQVSDILGMRRSVDFTSQDYLLLVKSKMAEQIFLLINAGLFLTALLTVFFPLTHLLFIQAIYFAFVWNNQLQAHWFKEISTPQLSVKAVQRVIDSRHWMRSENAPAVFGYFGVIAVVVILSWLMQCDGVQIDDKSGILGAAKLWLADLKLVRSEWDKNFLDLIKAFAAGAAGYHIALSTTGYMFNHREHVDGMRRASGAKLHVTVETVLDKMVELGSGGTHAEECRVIMRTMSESVLKQFREERKPRRLFRGVAIFFVLTAVIVILTHHYHSLPMLDHEVVNCVN